MVAEGAGDGEAGPHPDLLPARSRLAEINLSMDDPVKKKTGNSGRQVQ
jgi:hypothetical protein